MLKFFTCIIVLAAACFVLALPVVSPAQRADGTRILDERVKALEAEVVALKETFSELEKEIHRKAPAVVQVQVSSHLHVRADIPFDGRVVSWGVREGQLVKEGDTIAEISRAEGVQTISAPFDAYVASIPLLKGKAAKIAKVDVKRGEVLVHLLRVNEE